MLYHELGSHGLGRAGADEPLSKSEFDWFLLLVDTCMDYDDYLTYRSYANKEMIDAAYRRMRGISAEIVLYGDTREAAYARNDLLTLRSSSAMV